MWKKLAPLLIVLSVALNIAFAGVWAYHAFDSRGHTPQKQEYKGKIWCPLHRQLNVSDEQWKKIEPGILEFKRVSKILRSEIARNRVEMIDLVASARPDRLAIEAKQDEIRAGQRRMQQLVIDHLLAEKELLTPAQQKEFFDMLRKRIGCKRAVSIIGMGQTGDSACTGKENDCEAK